MPLNVTSSGRSGNYTGSRSNSPLDSLLNNYENESEDFYETLNFTDNNGIGKNIINLTENTDKVPDISSGYVAGS